MKPKHPFFYSLLNAIVAIIINISSGFAQGNTNFTLPINASISSMGLGGIENVSTTICFGDSIKLISNAAANISSIENLDSGLIGYWPFNGNANDESGNENHGMINGATLTSDRFGNNNKAYHFNGSEYIYAQRDTFSSFSASAWVYIEQVQLYTPIIDANVCNWEMMVDYGKHPKFIEFQNNIIHNELIATNIITLNNWFNLVSVFNNNSVSMYLNGSLIQSFSNVSLTSTPNSYFFFGASPSGSMQYLKGKLDDIKIWNRALSSQEILQLYNIDNFSYSWSTGDSTPSICISPSLSTTYYLTISNGINSSIDSIQISVLNSIPQASAHDTIVYLDSNGAAFINYEMIDNGSSDFCGIDSIWISDTVINCPSLGGYSPIKLFVKNSIGNIDSATAIVLVVDTIAPKIRNQNYTSYLCSNGTSTLTNAAIFDGISDNCAVVNYNITSNSFTCADVGINNAIISVTDQNGNVATASATINVLDTVRPLVATQNITIYLDENGTASIAPSDVDNFSADNCSISTMDVMPNAFTCADIGINTVVLKVTDASGNENSAIAMVTILDTIAPTAIIQNTSIYLDLNGTASLTPGEVNNGSTDNCSITNMNVYPNNFNQANIGDNLIAFKIVDQCGNRDSTYATVTVKDTIPPTPLVQNISVYLDSNGHGEISANQIDNGSFDNCGVDSVFLSKYEFSCADIGENKVDFTVFDINGNRSTILVTVTVLDTISPSIRTKNLILYVDAHGKASTSASEVNAGSYDNCGVDSMYLSNSSFDYIEGDRIVVDLFVTDVNGNLNSSSAVVNLIDTIAPDITCPESFGTCDINISYKFPLATDNTEIKRFEQMAGLKPGDTFEVGLTTNTFVATDLSGNQSTCSFEIERYRLPTVNAIQDTTVYYAENLSLSFTDSLAVSHYWTPSDFLSDANMKNPICSPTENINYTVEVASENGCKASDNVNVSVLNEIKFAKAFSPNGDGQNDFFEMYGIELYPDCKITILNRLGTIVFTSNGYAEPWNGTFKNEVLPVASYFYVIELGGNQKPLTGPISIIR